MLVVPGVLSGPPVPGRMAAGPATPPGGGGPGSMPPALAPPHDSGSTPETTAADGTGDAWACRGGMVTGAGALLPGLRTAA